MLATKMTGVAHGSSLARRGDRSPRTLTRYLDRKGSTLYHREVEPVIATSARKHQERDDFDDGDILHAYCNAISRTYYDDGFTMHVGPTWAGNMLEIGTVDSADGTVVTVHAMKYRPEQPR